ncbi:hypothetical protein D3C80_1558730 [compost metagenome]
MVCHISLSPLLFPYGQAIPCGFSRVFPAIAKDRPFLKEVAHVRAGFHDGLHFRCHFAAEYTLIIEEFNHGHSRVSRARRWRIRIVQQGRLVIHHADGERQLFPFPLLFLQFHAYFDQNVRMGSQVLCSDFTNTGLLLRTENGRRGRGVCSRNKTNVCCN